MTSLSHQWQFIRLRGTVAWIFASSHPQFRRLCAISSLQLASVYCYLSSLAGGDVNWVKDHLFGLGMYLLVSILCFCAAVLVSVGLHPPKWRLSTILALVGISLFEFLIDRGDNFYSHGSYNALLFLLLSFILLSISLSVMLCHSMARRKDVFWKVFITLTALVLLVTFVRLGYYRSIWGHGLLGHRMSHPGDVNHDGACSFEYRGNWPFLDLLPDGIQNFWTGSQTCPAQAFSIEADIDDKGVLTMNCKSRQGKAYYTILPDTRKFQTSDKVIGKLHLSIHKQSSRVEYLGPVQLERGQEAVIVQCGETVQELRYNIQVSSRFASSGVTGFYKEWKTKSGDNFKNLKNGNRDGDEGGAKVFLQSPNVLVIFMDAVSRRHAFRKLPKTLETVEKMHAPSSDGSKSGTRLFQFFRYHVVGFNTNHNTRALYTGNRTKDADHRTIVEDLVVLTDVKYMTLRAETNCEDWSSEYSGRATSEAYDHELLTPFCQPSYYSHDGHPFGNFKGPYSILRRCLFDRYVHKHTLEYMYRMQRKYREQAPQTPWFMTGSFIEGHEGTGEVLSTLDNDLSEFLFTLNAEGALKNTVVFIISDHGLHMGLNFVYSTNGIIEHANPLFMALLPESMLTPESIEILEHNEQALITGVNIYDTWRDVFNIPEHPLSLMQTKFPIKATCKDAGVSHEFCQCK